MLSRLQLRGVRRQEQEVHMVRHAQPHTGMPTGAVEHQHDLLGRTRPTCRAKAASSTSKSEMLSVVAR